MSDSHKELIQGNKNWVDNIKRLNPEFFSNLAKGQNPEFLWIGCADSRVPATEVTNSLPGSIFVHRNIANMVVLTDYNMLSVVYYAVKVLKVKHIIVCGHYGCGGVKAAMSTEKFGFIDGWLSNIKNVQRMNTGKLELITDENERFDKLVELNVIEQALNLSKISFIQEEWENGEFPYIHGWVYSLEDGLIRDLGLNVNSAEEVEPEHRFKKSKAAAEK